MTATPDQIAKLPKWARDHIASLERETAALRKELANRDFPHKGSNTQLIGWSRGNQPLPNGASIGFGGNLDEEHSTPWFQVRLVGDDGNGGVAEPGDLEIHGAESVMVVPQVTNVVLIRLTRTPR